MLDLPKKPGHAKKNVLQNVFVPPSNDLCSTNIWLWFQNDPKKDGLVKGKNALKPVVPIGFLFFTLWPMAFVLSSPPLSPALQHGAGRCQSAMPQQMLCHQRALPGAQAVLDRDICRSAWRRLGSEGLVAWKRRPWAWKQQPCRVRSSPQSWVFWAKASDSIETPQGKVIRRMGRFASKTKSSTCTACSTAEMATFRKTRGIISEGDTVHVRYTIFLYIHHI